jgi:hypothetical protein
VARQSPVLRITTPTILTAVLASGSAVVINLATEWKHNIWLWVAAAALTVATAAVALWLARAQATGGPEVGGIVRGDVKMDARDGSVVAWQTGDVTIENNAPGNFSPDPR